MLPPRPPSRSSRRVGAAASPPLFFSGVFSPEFFLLWSDRSYIAPYGEWRRRFKSCWSHGTENRRREQTRARQAGWIRSGCRPEGSDEAVLGARLRRNVV